MAAISSKRERRVRGSIYFRKVPIETSKEV